MGIGIGEDRIMTTCESCATFTLTSDSGTVYLKKPLWGGENYNINKDIS